MWPLDCKTLRGLEGYERLNLKDDYTSMRGLQDSSLAPAMTISKYFLDSLTRNLNSGNRHSDGRSGARKKRQGLDCGSHRLGAKEPNFELEAPLAFWLQFVPPTKHKRGFHHRRRRSKFSLHLAAKNNKNVQKQFNLHHLLMRRQLQSWAEPRTKPASHTNKGLL